MGTKDFPPPPPVADRWLLEYLSRLSARQNIDDLIELTSPVSGDETYIFDVSANVTRKATIANLLATVGTSGTYTPTLTPVANVAASTAYVTQYIRVGNMVVVAGKVALDPTLAATATQLGISLPIASNLGADSDCGGVAFAPGIAGMGAAILGDAANNRAELQYISSDINNNAMFFVFGYQVI